MPKQFRTYWFKRRRFGYGWIPVTWQGWTAVGVYSVVILVGAILLPFQSEENLARVAGLYLMLILISALSLSGLCIYFSPSPKWRWGKRPSDNPDEDW